MTARDSFLFGLILVGFFGALAVADESVAIPDNHITPGVVADDGRDPAVVCATGSAGTYSQQHRATPAWLKTRIRLRDGCDPHNSEVDHRLPLALGGADVEANLWCQPAPAFHEKDKLETWAWLGVCLHHTMTLPEAQHMFLAPSDWRAQFLDVFGVAP